MKGRFSDLLQRIEKGEHLSGEYHRDAHDEGKTIVYGELTVVTESGGVFTTRNGKELNRFFADVSFWGCGVNSGVAERCACYESVGHWCA